LAGDNGVGGDVEGEEVEVGAVDGAVDGAADGAVDGPIVLDVLAADLAALADAFDLFDPAGATVPAGAAVEAATVVLLVAVLFDGTGDAGVRGKGANPVAEGLNLGSCVKRTLTVMSKMPDLRH
jgi:hypothetical protein